MSLDTSFFQFCLNLESSSVNSWTQHTLSMTSPSPDGRPWPSSARLPSSAPPPSVCSGLPAVSLLQADVLSTKQLSVPSLQCLWLTQKPSSWSLRLAHKASTLSHTASLGASELRSSPDPNITVLAMPCVFMVSCCPCLPAWPLLVTEHACSSLR